MKKTKAVFYLLKGDFWVLQQFQYGSFPKTKGPQSRPQNTRILFIGTPENGTP